MPGRKLVVRATLFGLLLGLTPVASYTQPVPAWTAEGNRTQVFYGFRVESAGDVNGDGYDDVIVGAPFWASSFDDEGAAFIYYGGPSGPSPSMDWMVRGDQENAYYGWSVASAGDVDGNGCDDVLVGAYLYDGPGADDCGRAYLYLGSPAGLATVPAWTYDGDHAAASLGFGFCLARAGDVDGDGFSDVLVGEAFYDAALDGDDEGRIMLFHGNASGLGASPAWTYEGTQPSESLGYAVEPCGDLNDDGFADFAAGAIFRSTPTGTGATFVWLGGDDDPTGPVWVADGQVDDVQLYGSLIVGDIDVNGDGYEDLLTGAHMTFLQLLSSNRESRADLFLGTADGFGLAETPVWTSLPAKDGWTYRHTASVGDANGDGYDDVIFGALKLDSGIVETGVRMHHGSATFADDPAWEITVADTTLFGWSAAGAGDVNGDGYDDVIVGEFSWTGGNVDEGRAFVYHSGAGTVPAVVGGDAANDLNVDATVRADFGATSATLRYRAGGESAYTSVVMSPARAAAGGDAAFEGTIPAAVLDERGVQYYVVASNGQWDITIPPGAPFDAAATATLDVSDVPVLSLPSRRYALGAIPLAASDPDPLAVFDELGEYGAQSWKYGTFSGSGYSEPPAAADAGLGQGFWVISNGSATVRTSGVTTRLDQPFVITAPPGWSMIGNPFPFSVPIDDVFLPSSVEPSLVGWNGTSYVTGVSTLQPGAAYWVNNTGVAAPITISPFGALGGARASRAKELDPAWVVDVQVHAGAFGARARLGALDGASTAKDRVDLSAPPAPPEGYVTVASQLGPDLLLRRDLRAADSAGETFHLVIESDRAGERLTLTFDEDGTFPAGWRRVAFVGTAAREVAVDAGATWSVPIADAALEPIVLAVGPERYVDEVGRSIADAVPVRSVVGAVHPNPARAGQAVRVAIVLPEGGAVRADVFDVSGRRVRALHRGVVPGGVHVIAWDGTDDRGRAVAAGVYLVEVTAGDRTETRKLVVR